MIGLKTITVEALVRADELNNKISTLMGIEGKFLLRFSDQGLPGNQLQLATTSTNATNPNWTIETGKGYILLLLMTEIPGSRKCLWTVCQGDMGIKLFVPR